ncbi:MAG: ankyrin repeat domain-containing protein [Alphaproteobacteria bacterium]|nr:ankyrin repeat domain-containing protein [Alphaproteobacteria bacterium]
MTNWKDTIETNNIKAVQNLINSGADVNEPDENGFTPLMIATTGQNRKIVKALIKAGANVNEPLKNGETPLMHAVAKWCADPKIIKILINAGADINARDAHGKTPLMYASEGLFLEPKTMKILLDAGVKSAKRKRAWLMKFVKQMIKTAAQSRLFIKSKELLDRLMSSAAEKLRKVPFLAKDNRFDRMCAFYQNRKKECRLGLGALIILIGFGIYSHMHSYTATRVLNCRDQAGTHGKIIGKIAKGEKVSCSAFNDEWCKTVCNGKEGFVYKKYLSK